MFYKYRAYLALFLFVFCAMSVVYAQYTTTSVLPAKMESKIQLQIQKTMSFTTSSETATLLWTPKVIQLQKGDAESSMLPNPYSPSAVTYHLLYDVGMGHNMESDPIYWRQCEVSLQMVANVWSEPLFNCEPGK